MRRLNRLKRIMEDPQRKYGVYPIIHHRILQETLVEENDRNGFAGVVGNIEYRDDFDDNAAVWEQTANVVRKYIDRGMHVWLYDEDGYPSGVAGGYLTEKYPEHIAKGLYCYEYWNVLKGPKRFRAAVPPERMWRAVLVSTDGEKILDISSSLNKNEVLHFDIPEGEYKLIILSVRRLFDGAHPSESWSTPRNYINLFDGEAVGKFIEMTHEKYKQQLGNEFGKGVVATFTDEPSMIAWYLKDGLYPYLAWQEDLPERFYEKYGYDYLYACIAVLKGTVKNAVKLRCDYWEFLADATADGYFKQIQDWCHANNLKSSGHFIGEELLAMHVVGYGSYFRCMRHLDWPGIDMLYTTPEALMEETRMPVGRLAACVADISGENEVFTEFSDHYLRSAGGFAEKEVYYCSVNWHIAQGVNNFTSYYSFAGFDAQEKQKFNRYVARCGEVMRMGIRDSRTAVLYPECDMWAAFQTSAEYAHTNEMGGEAFAQIQKDFRGLTWELLHRQVDFDYIDNGLLLQAALKDGKLCYRSRCYSELIIPSFTVVPDQVAQKVLALARNGVRIRILRGSCALSRDTGEASPYAGEFMQLLRDGKISMAENPSFDGAWLRTAAPQNGLMTHCRKTEDGTRIIFAANMGRSALSDTLTVKEVCSRVYMADPETGAVEEIPFTKNGESVCFSIKIGGLKAKIYMLEQD